MTATLNASHASASMAPAPGPASQPPAASPPLQSQPTSNPKPNPGLSGLPQTAPGSNTSGPPDIQKFANAPTDAPANTKTTSARIKDELNRLTERDKLRDTLTTSCNALWEMELELITKAGKEFNRDEFKNVDDPRKYSLEDPRRWTATIEVSQSVKAVLACIEKDAGATAGAADLDEINKKIAAKNTVYWQAFEQSKSVDPLWHQAATTFIEATKCIESLSAHDPAKAKSLLVDMGNEYKQEQDAKPSVTTVNISYHAEDLAPRMTTAFLKLAESHNGAQAEKDKDNLAADKKPLLDAALIQTLGTLWANLNKSAANETAKPSEETLRGFEDLQKRLRELRAAIDASAITPVPPVPPLRVAEKIDRDAVAAVAAVDAANAKDAAVEAAAVATAAGAGKWPNLY